MLKDRFGNEVFVGCTVAYPGRAGNGCWMSTGRVVEIDEESYRDDTRPWLPQAKLRLEGGSRGAPGDELGRRWIMFTSEHVLVLGGHA